MTDILEESLIEGFERELYQAALANLDDKNNKLRLNNFAYAMRELVRHVLHRLAPDHSVVQCVWFKNESEKPNTVTRRQRAIFAVQGGLSDDYITNTLDIDVHHIHKSLIDATNNLNKFTHVEPCNFGLSVTEVDLTVAQTLDAVRDLFTTIQQCRDQIIESLWDHIDDGVIDKALGETIRAIDRLATHHFIEEVYTDKVTVTAIQHDRIHITATGIISCELQWGSNSDVRKGEGAIMSDSYPFSCHLSSPIDDPSSIKVHESGLLVDTSSWGESDQDDEA